MSAAFDTSRGADNILPLLSPEQVDFILRMKPHARSQYLSAKDWRAIDCKVDNPDPDGWPYWHWFGGMRATSGSGTTRWTRTFQFNADGLAVRERLLNEQIAQAVAA